MAAIVAFVSQKGGVGKSTLARALAREAAAGGLRVKVADLDTQQGTAVDWHRLRLSQGTLEAAKGYDLLIIDGPARTSSATLDIARAADLIVQPSGASRDDLIPAVREFHALTKAGVPNDRLAFALNRIGTPAEEVAARVYLQQAGYPVREPTRPAGLPPGAKYRSQHHRNPLCGSERAGRHPHSIAHRPGDKWLTYPCSRN